MRTFYGLVVLLSLAVFLDSKSLRGHGEKDGSAPEDTRSELKGVKQASWRNRFFVREGIGKGQFIGKLHSDDDVGDGSVQYILSGEGNGDVFTINQESGELFTTRSLDREEKAIYSLTFKVVNTLTGQVVEPETEFSVVVLDVNDHAPAFSQDTYVATVPEHSNLGTSVTQVTATDVDVGLNGQIFYSITGEHSYFSVDPTTGVIRSAVGAGDLDREQMENHQVFVKATDMSGQKRGLSSTTVVNITVTDINDNLPRFAQGEYQFSVPESIKPGSTVGRLKATDPDVGKNAEMQFSIIDGDHTGMFEISTDEDTQEGVIIVRKPLDYERKQSYTVLAKVKNQVQTHPMSAGSVDMAQVEISVEDVDEPPVFYKEHYLMEVKEDASVGTTIGFVYAMDTDRPQTPVKYSIDRDTDMNHRFDIDEASGTLTVAKSLDREAAAWHNISVIATEASDNPPDSSRVPVYIHIQDINDNPPMMVVESASFVCEGHQTAGQLVQTVTAVDLDEPPNGHKFSFSMAPDEEKTSLFTVQDNGDNTAGILTRQANFDRLSQNVHQVPVVITDGETPMHVSTSTVIVKVCSCKREGHCDSEAESFFGTLGVREYIIISLALGSILLMVCALVKISCMRMKPTPSVPSGPDTAALALVS
ncbi:cadherin-6-like [Synchiropus splendidus]|uniref:cadherin-6-like n=1 Tax=Synchiropus splendidus TaxID=270530 RepID=UPI00237E081F|nr:cadherin-6-like [Synchiropus splendidus]